MQETKIILSEKEMPKQWYNIAADMPKLPKPPLHLMHSAWRFCDILGIWCGLRYAA